MKRLNEIKLPKSSKQQELAALSTEKFSPLFEKDRFILKPEDIDNGIDFRIELIKNGNVLGFEFNIQLKSTESIEKNADGSYSKSIETSNIEYLINNGSLAYYVFYVRENDTFYYESLNDFCIEIATKNPDWEDKESHTLRFSKVLDKAVLDKMYDDVIRHGETLRNVHFNRVYNSLPSSEPSNFIIDPENLGYSESELKEKIERYGFSLMNEGKWSVVLQMHNKVTGGTPKTALYNMVVGAANYYKGEYLTALQFLHKADLLKGELDEKLLSTLEYHILEIKLSLSMITLEEYTKRTEKLLGKGLVSLYVRMEAAKEMYLKFLMDIETYENIEAEFNSIINDSDANDNVRYTAKSELSLIQGHILNKNYLSSISHIKYLEANAFVNEAYRVEVLSLLQSGYNSWEKEVLDVSNEAREKGDLYSFFQLEINRIKILYELEVYKSRVYLDNKNQDGTLQVRKDKDYIRKLIEVINNAISFYRSVDFSKNILWSLTVKYEMTHYIEDFNTASDIIKEIELLVTQSSYEVERKKVELLRNNGTTHEKFYEFTSEIFKRKKSDQEERLKLIEEMKKMDEEDANSGTRIDSDFHVIELYPIQHFCFSSGDLNQILEIINLKDNDLIRKYKEMVESKIIPVANILNLEIKNEGYGDGAIADKGIESWRNIYRIRKHFFQNGYRRCFLNENKT